MKRIPSTLALQCFEASARLRSFTAAGTELELTQGGVSRQVIGLESRLGFALLERKRNGLSLTAAGSAYLAELEPALRALERATSNLMALGGEGGVLNLSIPASWGNYWLIPQLHEFTQRHPEISLNVFTKIGPADFSNRQIDAAVEFYAFPPEGVECEFVMPLKLSPYASPSFKQKHGLNIPAAAMLQHTTVPQAWQAWQEAHGKAPAKAASGSRYDLMFMAMNAAANGLGAALLPEFMTTTLVNTRRLSRLSTKAWQTEGGYYLSKSPLLRSERAYLRFREWLRERCSLAKS